MNYRLMTMALLGMLTTLPFTQARADEPPMHNQKKLGLTDDQAGKLKAVREAQKTALKPLWDKQKGLRDKLADQVKSKASDPDIQGTLDEMNTTHKAIMDQLEQFRSQKEAILTPTQKAKMILGLKKRHAMQHHDQKEGEEEKDDGR